MIVNELKTKVIAFGCKDIIRVLFNGQQIETAFQCKYLGNIISTTQTSKGDVFRENYDYLCSQARKAIFGLKHRLKSLGALPPRVLMHMYETLIRPILVYGSDVWGSQPQGTLLWIRYSFGICVVFSKSNKPRVTLLRSGKVVKFPRVSLVI